MAARRVAAVAAIVAIVVALAATAYVFRSHFGGVRLVGRLVAPQTDVVAGPPPQADMPTSGGAPPSGAEEPRGDVTIDARRQQLIGVRLAPVQRTLLSATIRTTGVVRYDETRQTDVNVKLDGWIRDLYVDYTGQPVRRGDRLFTLYSPELLATQNEFLLALKNREQMQGSQVADAREYADRLVDAARQRLALWDLSPEQVATIEQTRQPLSAVTFTAPANGFVVEKQAVRGMHVTSGQTLYKVADVSVVWIEADVYEQDIASLRVGAPATVTLDAYPGQNFAGRAIYIYPYVDENSRTAKVRMQFANPGGRLKPGMFAHVELRGAEASGLTIPADALLDSGKEQIVFVAEGDGMFSPRHVTAGRRTADVVEITKGLKEGEQVATGAAFFLDSESQLRAGLQNYEPPAGASSSTVSTPSERLNIAFRPQPDPPRTGESTFEVTVKDSAGMPVADAEVTATLFMPAMPTMNMPAMRSATTLASVGNGVYRGTGQVLMVGRWDVTVNVSKGGQRLGTGQFALTAK
jgi:Cu(I)/Ag(I) efflux system membrane fusion protein/cobalt-zinc-cadmium efflux system membrane fusion protein